MPEEDDWNAITLDQLRAWDWAPEDAAVLRAQNLEVALTTYELEDKSEFRKNLAYAMDRGFSENDALAALTTVPAKLCGVEQSLGTVEPGKMANLTVVSGKGYFDPEAKVKEVWIDGRFYRTETEEPKAEAAKEEKPDETKRPKRNYLNAKGPDETFRGKTG
jgi:imidazolonepropionase-like amidohydrolase